jgi:protein involved in polysaccharide export with SLBB domain
MVGLLASRPSTRLTRRDRAAARTTCLVVCVVLTLGCARRAAPPPPPVILESGPYRIQPGDMVDVKFLYHSNESQRLPVRADGILALGVTGDLDVGGLTVAEVEDLVRARASRWLRDPVVAVTVAETGARAYVGGEVSEAGFVSLAKPMTPLQAILERGGFTPGADLKRVTIISKASGTPVSRQVDVRADADAPVTLLTPDDVVFVPKTGIASANAWVNSWIDGLTPQLLKGLRFPTF